MISTLALGPHRIPGLDGWRGIAAVLVAAGHYTQLLVSEHPGFAVSVPAGAGPTLFFLLSGFLLTRSLLNEQAAAGTIDLRRFYWRRLIRFAPAYFAFVLLIWAFYSARGFPWPWQKVVLALLVAPNWYNVIWDEQSINVVYAMWSLGVGVQFFLVWPLLLRPLLRTGDPVRLVPWLAGAALVIGVVRTLLSLEESASWLYLYNAPHMRADALLLGCLLAMLAVRRTTERRAMLLDHPALGWAALLLLVASSVFGSNGYLRSVGHSVNAVLGAVLLWQIVQARSPRLVALLEVRPLRYLGVLGFSLLLWHNFAITLHGRTAFLPLSLRMVTVAVMMLLLALASFLALERSVLRRLAASDR